MNFLASPIHANLEFVTEIKGSRPSVVSSRKGLWSVMPPENHDNFAKIV